MEEAIKKAIAPVEEFIRGVGRRRITTNAASAAYFFFMSLVPIIVIVLSLLPYTPLTEVQLLRLLQEIIPEYIYELVVKIVELVYEGSAATLSISVVMTLWSTSSAMCAVMRGMDRAYDAPPRRGYIRFRLKGLAAIVIFLLSMIFTFVFMVYGWELLEFIHMKLPDTPIVRVLYEIVRIGRYGAVWVMLVAAFMVLYKWTPNRDLRFRDQILGALFTATVWILFSAVFSLYLKLSDRFGIYGLLGTIMVAMLWLYWCFYFLLMGGYINRYIETLKEHKKGF